MWNLDFLRSVFPPFCLHPKLNAMHIIALEYILAIYPMVLIILTYLTVCLHDRYSLVVSLCRPVHKILACVRKEWSIRGSLVQTFASLLVLSYVKILNTSFELLNRVSLLDMSGKHLNQSYLYIAGTIEYFGHSHLPFGILAIAMLVVFNILPVMLLLLYPYQWFQKIFTCGRYKQYLVIFTDAFYGYYKPNPKCSLSFSAAYFISYFVILYTLSIFNDYTMLFFSSFYLVLLASAVIILRPYKAQSWNTVNFVLILCAAFLYSTEVMKLYLKVYEPHLHRLIDSVIMLISSSVWCFIILYIFFILIIPLYKRIKRVASKKVLKRNSELPLLHN